MVLCLSPASVLTKTTSTASEETISSAVASQANSTPTMVTMTWRPRSPDVPMVQIARGCYAGRILYIRKRDFKIPVKIVYLGFLGLCLAHVSHMISASNIYLGGYLYIFIVIKN
jgi:hypothetical protein